MLRFRTFLEGDDRTKGASLPERGYRGKYVEIFRAVAATEMRFKPMDYVGVGDYGRRFCVGHAQHQAVVMSEPYHVIRAVVRADLVFEAYNPGEYFYDGPVITGKPIPGSRAEPP